jgi:APA family basic amino acid/polyamine antiporter
MEQQAEARLVRAIRKWDLIAVTINGIIGAGIFGLPSKVYALTGAYSVLSFIVCALIVTLIVLCFAEVGSRFSQTGGPYLYARQAFGPAIGFQVGWMIWLARLTAFAANCNLLVGYIGYFWPEAATKWRTTIIVSVVVLITAVNVIGVRDAAIVSDVATIGKLIPIVLFIAVGSFFISPQNFSLATKPDFPTFSTSVLILIYAFTGFEMAVIPAGEILNPRRNLPLAMLLAIGTVVLLYVAIQVVCIGTLPGLADSDKPLADASRRFLGEAGARVISAGALVSIIGNLSVVLLAGSRLPFAMAERHELPQLLASTHSRFHTPHIAILVTATIMLVLTISGTFAYAATLSAIARLLSYAATCAALPVLRRRRDISPALFSVPAGAVISIITLALSAWLLASSTRREARDAAIAIALGLLIYFAYRIQSKGMPEKGGC